MNKLYFSVLAIAISVAGCGGGGKKNAGPKIFSGVFKDSNVQGVDYVSGGQKNITGANGEFKYEENSNITFSVGGVKLGTAKAKSVMTPKDLVSGGDVNTPKVLNLVRFLMMLDKDNNPDNGIVISPKVQQKAKSWEALDFSDDKFNKTDPATDKNSVAEISKDAIREDGGQHDLPTAEEAKTHFTRTLEIIKSTERCVDAGAFTGTYSGTEQGNIAFILDPATGDIKGSLFNTAQSENHTPIAIEKETAIDYENQSRNFISLSSSGIRFTGALKAGGNALQGTWVDKDDSTKKGTFAAARIAGNSGANFRYNALYEGLNTNDLGVLAMDVVGNRVTGKLFNVETATELEITGGVANEQFNNVKLSDGGAVTGFISESSLSGTIRENSNNTNSFTGSGCKLN